MRFFNLASALLLVGLASASPLPQEGEGSSGMTPEQLASLGDQSNIGPEDDPDRFIVDQPTEEMRKAFNENPNIASDRRDSSDAPHLELMDDQQSGLAPAKTCATRDEECKSACSNGLSCKNPEALIPGKETCRSGIGIDFPNGEPVLSVKDEVSQPPEGETCEGFVNADGSSFEDRDGGASGDENGAEDADSSDDDSDEVEAPADSEDPEPEAVEDEDEEEEEDADAEEVDSGDFADLGNDPGLEALEDPENRIVVQDTPEKKAAFEANPNLKESRLDSSVPNKENIEGIELLDDKISGLQITSFCGTRDEECKSACSDGVLCRNIESLRDGQTCRDGFTLEDLPDGKRRVVKLDTPSSTDIAGEPGAGKDCPIGE